MSFRGLVTFLFSSSVLFSVVAINFLPVHFHSTILTFVCFANLFQLMIQKPSPPLWQVLYVISIIFFLCLNEVLATTNLFDIGNYISLTGVGYHYSTEAYNKAIIYIVYFVSGTYFAIVFLSAKVNSMSILPRKNIMNIKSFKVFFYICFFFMLFDKLSIYSTSKIVGYVEAIHSASSSSPFFILIDILYPVLYSILAIAYRCKKISSANLAFFTLVFVTPYFFTFLSGYRGEFTGKLIALTILYSSIIRFPRYYYVIGGSIVLIGILGMEFIRFDDSLSLFSLPLESYFLAFSYLGNSFDVIPLAIDYQANLFHGWKYFFGGPLAIFSFEPTYSAQGILTKPYLAQHLMSVVDYTRFSGGSTIGSSVIAEIFLFTPYLIFPCSYFIMWATKFMINKSFYSVLFFYISLSYFENLLFIARGGFLKFIDKELFLGVIIILLFVNLSKFKKKYISKHG